MLKSYSTQFALAFFFGPIGLAYSSMATAVLLTLTMLVLYFNVMGLSALVVSWSVAIVVGQVLVKLHNERSRQVGASLLVARQKLTDLGTLFAAWTRGFAVMVVVLGAGFLAYQYGPKAVAPMGKMVEESGVSEMWARSSEKLVNYAQQRRDAARQHSAEKAQARAERDQRLPQLAQSKSESKGLGSDGSTVIVNASSKPPSRLMAVGRVVVDTTMVNLRDGPGMEFPIIATAKRGDELIEFARAGSWINVEVSETGRNAWVFGQLIKR